MEVIVTEVHLGLYGGIVGGVVGGVVGAEEHIPSISAFSSFTLVSILVHPGR